MSCAKTRHLSVLEEAKQTVAKCKGYQKAKKGGKEIEEFSEKELKGF